ncbi:hypothetical protein phiOC_p225 [Ochrobactrum phage vB_OspM_OC]|nr:hypothetical protein phiOC_p225 [Ochrobactrum phage vB_OspM_OC]
MHVRDFKNYNRKAKLVEKLSEIVCDNLSNIISLDDMELAYFGANNSLNVISTTDSGSCIKKENWYSVPPVEDRHLALYNILKKDNARGGLFIWYKTHVKSGTVDSTRYQWFFLPYAWLNPMCRYSTISLGQHINHVGNFVEGTRIPIINRIHNNSLYARSSNSGSTIMSMKTNVNYIDFLDEIYGYLREGVSYLSEKFDEWFLQNEYWIGIDNEFDGRYFGERLAQVVCGSQGGSNYLNLRQEGNDNELYHIPDCLLNLYDTYLEHSEDYLYFEPMLESENQRINWLIQNYPYFGVSDNECWDRSPQEYKIVDGMAINVKTKKLFLISNDKWHQPLHSEQFLGVIKSCHEMSTRHNQLHPLI